MTTPIHIRAHGTVLWRRHRLFLPLALKGWRGIPYYRWKYYMVEIVGEGWTQAERDPLDVHYMACDYMACKHDKEASDYHVESIEWIRHH